MNIFWIIVLIIIAYLVVKSVSNTNSSTRSTYKKPVTSRRKGTISNDGEWLEKRWKLANDHKLSGQNSIFPKWYYEEVSERQLEKLKELGIPFNRNKITKGQASDIIGNHEPAESENLEVLKFFKVPTKGMKQTQARHEVGMIFDNENKALAWNQRPPTILQKEFFKFFGIKTDKGITNEQAQTLIDERCTSMLSEDDESLTEWEAFEQIIDELSDPDFREDSEIKKPSMTLIKQAIGELLKEGKSYQTISDDIDILVGKLIELKPDLQRG